MMNWRMQFPPGCEPPQGAPQGGPGGNYPYPFPYYAMPPFGIPPNMQPGQGNNEKPEGDKTDKQDDDKPKFKPFREDTDSLKRRAAAQAKLQQLEQKMNLKPKKSDDLAVEDLDKEPASSSSHLKPKNQTDMVRPTIRSRNNSEASDSSRRSGKDVPPRFQRKRSTQDEVQEADNEGMFSIICFLSYFNRPPTGHFIYVMLCISTILGKSHIFGILSYLLYF